MANLREILRARFPEHWEEIRQLIREQGDTTISEVTVRQAYGGMRGVKALVCNTSYVDPDKGLFVRGIPIGDLTDRLPEEILFLLLTGELPDAGGLSTLQDELTMRGVVPSYVWDVLEAMPEDSHPMAMLSMAIISMQRESVFKLKYEAGLAKSEFWLAALDDGLTLLARLPIIAAAIFRLRYKRGKRILPNPNLDYGANFANMLGVSEGDDRFTKLVRLYLVLHCDHEGGNVSAFTSRVVGSALSDIYYSLSAGLNGLAGPLHGLANQTSLKYIQSILDAFGKVPNDKELEEFIWATLKTGRVIPGYGHAVLRKTDPRFSAFLEFGKEHCPDDPIFQVVDRMFKIVPKVLKEHGKAKNPWPNVDAGSGSLLFHFGLDMFDFYTVMFAVSRAMGIVSQSVLARGLMAPIIRPKTITDETLRKIIKEKTSAKANKS